MKCKQAQSQFIDYIEGTLVAATKSIVDDHLAACLKCRDELRTIEEASGWLNESSVRLQETLTPSAELYSALMSRLQEAPTGISLPRRMRGSAVRIRQLASASRPRGIRIVAVAAVLAVIALAISLLVGVPMPGPGRLTPRKALARAYAAMAEVKSYHVTMTIAVNESTNVTTSYEGDVLLPDRRRMMVSMNGVPHHEDIWIGNIWYMRPVQLEKWFRGEIPTGVDRWVRSPLGLTPIPLAEGQPLTPEAMSDFVASLEGLIERPADIIDGVVMEHYKGVLNLPAYVTRLVDDVAEREAIIELMQESKWAVEVWVSKDDHLVRRVKLEIDNLPSQNGVVCKRSATSKFSEFNKPVQIEPPMEIQEQ